MRILALLTLLVGLISLAPAKAVAQDADHAAAPSRESDYRAAAVADLSDVAQKLVALAQAMPPDKFGWRPVDGAPTVSEVFVVAATQYYHRPHAWGGLKAAGYEYGGDALTRKRVAPPLHKTMTAKPDVLRELVDSTSYFGGIMKTLSDSDLQKPVKVLGHDVVPCDDLIVMVGDVHEDLARAIDYARMNGITFPWMNDWEDQQIKRGLRTAPND